MKKLSEAPKIVRKVRRFNPEEEDMNDPKKLAAKVCMNVTASIIINNLLTNVVWVRLLTSTTRECKSGKMPMLEKLLCLVKTSKESIATNGEIRFYCHDWCSCQVVYKSKKFFCQSTHA